MRMLNHLVLAGLLAPTLFVMVATDDDTSSGELDVTIRQEGDKAIQEYRANGFPYAIKAASKRGRPYFLVHADGSDDNFTHSDQSDKLVPQWEILSW